LAELPGAVEDLESAFFARLTLILSAWTNGDPPKPRRARCHVGCSTCGWHDQGDTVRSLARWHWRWWSLLPASRSATVAKFTWMLLSSHRAHTTASSMAWSGRRPA